MRRAARLGNALLLVLSSLPLVSTPVMGKDSPLALPKGARVGVVNLLDAEVTHFHTARAIQDSFLKTRSVGWQIDAMLGDALQQRFAQMGLVAVPLGATEALDRGREELFVNGSVSKGLPKACVAALAPLVTAEHLDALILLAPGLNNSAHAAGARRKDLPEYLRGWGFITTQQTASGAKPALFNMTQLLLVAPSPDGVTLQAREWGGVYSNEWVSFDVPADLKAIPREQLDRMQPLFADILSRQAGKLLDQVQAAGR